MGGAGDSPAPVGDPPIGMLVEWRREKAAPMGSKPVTLRPAHGPIMVGDCL
jgi:hypothetical protein